ncbi:MAG: signal peptidase II [Candidatus Tyrphobacter sp.]
MSQSPSFSPRASSLRVAAIGFIAVAVLIADQLSKRYVITHLYFDGQCIPWCGHKDVVAGWLRIAPEPNYHGAFGLLGSNAFLLVGMALVVLAVFWLSFRDAAERSTLVRVAFGLILGGAVSNIIDRVHFGYVVDFIDFYRFPDIWRFTFNVADSCITIGVVLLLLSTLRVTPRRQR